MILPFPWKIFVSIIAIYVYYMKIIRLKNAGEKNYYPTPWTQELLAFGFISWLNGTLLKSIVADCLLLC